MQSGVKKAVVNPLPVQGFLLTSYLVLSIAILGSFFAYSVSIPLHLLSRVLPRKLAHPVRGLAQDSITYGIRVLMKTQPWLKGSYTGALQDHSRGMLFVSNHRSHLDTFMLLVRIPRIQFLAKSSLFFVPLLGLYMRASRQISVSRTRAESFFAAMDEVEKQLKEGMRVHVFPEMTRCPAGMRGTQKFFLAPFHAALRSGALVVPVSIAGTDEYWPKGERFLKRFGFFRVSILEPIESTQFNSAQSLKSAVQAKIDASLQEVQS
jgi:1-acyl-sn-glycerol-3-phosphate acyltransferase